MPWFEYHQNNSGGRFDIREAEGITVYVVIEADDWQHANYLAKRIGLYFDGVEKGRDCDCCGDRWHSAYSGDSGTDLPEVYGKPLATMPVPSILWAPDGLEIAVHPRSGPFYFHKFAAAAE